MSDMSEKLALEHFLPYRLARIAEAVSQEFAQIYKQKAGLTRAEWRTLATIGQFERVTSSFVVQHSAMHKTKVSRAVAAMDLKGLIVKHLDMDDRRVEHLTLSKKGASLYKDLVQEAQSFENELLRQLGADAASSLDSGIGKLENAVLPNE